MQEFSAILSIRCYQLCLVWPSSVSWDVGNSQSPWNSTHSLTSVWKTLIGRTKKDPRFVYIWRGLKRIPSVRESIYIIRTKILLSARCGTWRNTWMPRRISSPVDLSFSTEIKPFRETHSSIWFALFSKYIGHDQTLFNGHSFRKGAATSAARANIPEHVIKKLGRWSETSTCHTRYINHDESVLAEAQSAMCKM